MSRTLDTVQAERALAQHLSPVPLVKITTYSDREAGTVGTVFYVSDRTVYYDYGNTGTTRTFLPWLLRIGDLRTSIDQVPSPDRGVLWEKDLELTLANHRWPDDDVSDFISEQLRATYRLENARVEVGQVLLAANPEKYPVDLSTWTGDEHTVFYRGVVTRVGPVDRESLRLACSAELPAPTPLLCSDAATNDPRDVGVRWPMPYGSDALVELVGRKVPAVTTLATGTGAGGTWLVTDTVGFPSSGSFRIGSETLTYTGTTATTFTGVSTPSYPHTAGEAIVEVLGSNLVFGVSDYPVKEIKEIYAELPTGGRVRVTTTYTKNATDSTTESQDTATIEFTPANWNTLLGLLAVAAKVAQDPSFTNDIKVTRVESCDSGTMGDDNFATTAVITDASPAYTSFPSLRSGEVFIEQRIEIYTKATAGGYPHNFRLAIGTDPSYTDFKSWTDRTNIELNSWDGKTTQYSGNDLKLYWPSGSSVSITIAEVRRILQVYAPNPEIDETTKLAASSGFLPRLWAVVDGVVAGPPFAGTPLYGFEDGSGWSVPAGCSHANEGSVVHGGTYSQKLTIERDLWEDCEDYTDWTATGSAVLSNQTSPITEGTYNLRISLPGDVDGGAYIEKTEVDLTDPDNALIIMTAYDSRSTNYEADYIRVTIGGHASEPAANHTRSYDFDPTDFQTILRSTLAIDYTEAADATSGTFDPEHWAYLLIEVISDGSSATRYFYVDDIGTLPKQVVMQKVDVTSPDNWSAGEDMYTVWLRLSAGAYQMVDEIELYFEDAAGSGHVLPATRRRILKDDWDSDDNDVWVQVVADAEDIGSPTFVDVQTVGIAVTHLYAHGHNTPCLGFPTWGLEVFSVYVDDLESHDYDPNPYSVAEGVVLEKPTDVITHVMTERGDVILDSSARTTALTNLDDNVMALDLRALGYTWQEQLARLGFEARCNLVPEETSVGTRWKMLTAESDYGWPAASGAISGWEDLVELSRDLAELSSSRDARYGLDASLGVGEDAFTKVLTDDDATARAAFGVRHGAPLTFLGIQNAATAAEVFGYYRYEDVRLAALFAVRDVPWWVGYALEVGDLRNLTPEYGSAIKVRVIEVIKRWRTEQVELRCVEVE